MGGLGPGWGLPNPLIDLEPGGRYFETSPYGGPQRSAPVAELGGAHGPKVIHTAGAKYSNVSQGDLGDCYYLAALAAIAYRQPSVIRTAFEEWGESVASRRTMYAVKFYVDGIETHVAVDDQVPMFPHTSNDPFLFASWNDGDDLWPVILEKAFAKVFGREGYLQTGWSGWSGCEVQPALLRSLCDGACAIPSGRKTHPTNNLRHSTTHRFG